MKTVIIDKENITLDIKSKALFVDTQRVPMQLIELLILNHTTQLDSKILIDLSRENIAVLMVSKNSKDFALTLPQVAKNSEQKIQQYKALENRLGYAKYFIHAKIETITDIIDDRHDDVRIYTVIDVGNAIGTAYDLENPLVFI